MKKLCKPISIFIIFATVALLFSSCKGETAGKNLWYPIEGNINTLDPQCAATSDELLIVQNTMEGLVRKNAQGEMIPGLAENWTISEDGLTYTFHLKKNVKWDLTETQKKIYETTTKKGEPIDPNKETEETPEFDPDITAEDFVFALRRASLASTEAPYFNSISGIQNAVAVHSGQADASTLGVTASDAHTLQIRLSAPDAQFLGTLATAIAMPCNQEFFEYTKGRYGLEKNYTLFNGPFFLSSWTSAKVVLKKSELYTEQQTLPVPEAVTLHVPENRDNILPNLLKGTYDVALISGKDSEKISEKNGITMTPFEGTVWSYLYNCGDAFMSNENIRKAVSYAMQPVGEQSAKYLNVPEGLVPTSCNINGTPYREYAGAVSIPSNNESAAVEAWMAGLKELNPTELDLTILCTEEMASYVKQNVQGLQKTLGNKVNYVNKNNTDAGLALSIKIETVSQEDFTSRLKAGTYQIAFYPLAATDDSALKFLGQFQSGAGYTNYSSASYDKLMERAEETRDAAAEAALLKQCEEELLSHTVVFPVLSESSYFAMAKGVSDISFSTSAGKVDFINGKRKD